jgi:hypothetical protein
MAVFQREPLFFANEGGLQTYEAARALSLEGRWLETEAGIRTRGPAVALTVAAQRRFRTGLSLVLRREYAVVNNQVDRPDAKILLQGGGQAATAAMTAPSKWLDERVDVYAVLCGRTSVNRVTTRSTAATAARTAPYANGAPGPTLSQRAPATRLAGSSAAPVAVAYVPMAVARSDVGTRSVISARPMPSVRA